MGDNKADPNSSGVGFGWGRETTTKNSSSDPGAHADVAEIIALPTTKFSRFSAGDFFAAPRAPLFSVGTVLGGRYEIVAQLGQGGMGAVYKAHDREVQRDVALKVIRPELVDAPSVLQRFKQELILARDVTHPNVVRIYDIGEVEGVKFITMEFVDGRDLGSLTQGGKELPPAQAADIMTQVSEGLEAVHKKGIIHRDLKPGNIMIDTNGRAVLMDFGLARSLESDGMTQTGALVGTMQYMSPEQAKAQTLDTRSDIYTLGLIFYELLTGVSPYASESVIVSLTKRTIERAAPPSSRTPNVPAALSDICIKCLEINPADRYQSIGELLAALDAWKSGKKTPSLLPTLLRWQRRVRPAHVIASIAATVVLAVLGFVVPRLTVKPATEHAPVSVLVADFTNHTGDPTFDGTLEPMFNVALEGAKFVNAFSRGDARKLATKLPNPTDKLDEQSSRLIAVSQSIGAVVTGAIGRRENGYEISVEALDGATGKLIASSALMVANKSEVLEAIPKLAVPIRKALGDSTPQSKQLNEVSGAFTAASLEVVHQEALGMEQQFAGKFEEALQSFSKAAELDSNFARAYSGMAAMAENLGKANEAEKYIRLALEHEDRMTERERYRTRGLFYGMTGNWQKCVDEYSQLVARYPADRIGQLNLASCFAQMRNIPKAVEAARRAVDIVPKGAFQRLNLSFLSSSSGDFRSGEQEARAALQLNPSSEVGYLMLAEAQLGQGQFAEAAETYNQLEKVNALGTSKAAAGLADLALYQGRFKDAARMLEQGATSDLVAKRPEAAANKLVALAYTELSRQQVRPAVAAAKKALDANSQSVGIRFMAARIFVEAGEFAKAQKLAVGLDSELQTEPQAYAKIIQGKLALKRGDTREAIQSLTEATKLLDTWIGRFELGRAYLQANAFVEADSEFDSCTRRQGEALELFMDDNPTFGYFPAVYYYQGRAGEGLKNSNYRDSYRAYLNIREKAGEDPLLNEVKTRAAQLTASK